MQMTEIRETRKEDSKVTIVFTNLQYLVLIGLLVAQSVDKVKDCSCLGVTIGLILFNFFL